MTIRIITVLLLSLVFYNTTWALTAGDLRDYCDDRITCGKDNSGCKNEVQRVRSSMCISYIQGFRNGHLSGIMNAIRNAKPSYYSKAENAGEIISKYSDYCLPDEVDADQIAELYLKFIEGYPEKLHKRASMGLFSSLGKYFPCK